MPKLESIIKLNRTQKYFLNEFKEDISDKKFEELKKVIEIFLVGDSHQEKNNKAVTKINWANDFVFNEILNHTVINLTNAYFKLSYNYSSHSNVKDWNKKEQEWREYRTSIKDMFFESKEEVQKEIDRIVNEYKQVLEIDKIISKN